MSTGMLIGTVMVYLLSAVLYIILGYTTVLITHNCVYKMETKLQAILGVILWPAQICFSLIMLMRKAFTYNLPDEDFISKWFGESYEKPIGKCNA